MSITLAAEAIPPDVIGAIIARLRRFADVMSLCADETVGGRTVRRVSGQLQAVPAQQAWTGHAAVVRPAGGDGPDPAVPFDAPRVDVLCYGATGYEAGRLARVVAAALDPVARRGQRFVEGDCAVTDARQVAGPLPFYDRENRAHVRALTFEVRYCLVPVGVTA